MNTNNELTRDDIVIDSDIQVSDENDHDIIAYVETWFDVDKKFNVDTTDDDVWLNMYGIFNPYEDTLKVECVISDPLEDKSFSYEPTENEAQLIKDMITEKIRYQNNQTPQEFCNSAYGEDMSIGGIK